MYCIPFTSSLRHFVSSSPFFPSCLRAFVPPCLLLLAFCYLSPSALAQVQIVEGAWSWPDQGLGLWDPNGDTLGGAVVMDMLAAEGKLVVVGAFNYAGGADAKNVAVWDGESWGALGDTSPSASVRALLAAEGALYIGGGFNSIGPLSAKGVAKWDGIAWSVLGSGPGAVVRALAWWDDGRSPGLYAGGDFLPARLKRWDGAVWSPVGGGCTGTVAALAVFDDGAGPALYAGGYFGNCGGAGSKIARWDGQAWSSLGIGITDSTGNVKALAGFDDGSGPALYVGGSFNEVSGLPMMNIARWNGQAWSAVGDPGLILQQPIETLRVLDEDGPGPNPPALFAIGGSIIQKWDGKVWKRYQPQPGGLLAAEVFPGPDGQPTLHVGGEIALAVGQPPQTLRVNIARWDSPAAGFGCGDFDGDGAVTQADLGILLAAFDNCPGPNCPGDANGDGVVDQQDLGILLANFGQECG
jgi:hypothetical protein